MTTLHDVLIIGAGPCALAVAARLREPTPSAIFTDEEHQRYYWINKHRGRMALVQAQRRKLNGVRAETWHAHASKRRTSDLSSASGESASTSASVSSVPSLASSPSSVDMEMDMEMDTNAQAERKPKLGNGLGLGARFQRDSDVSTLVLDGTGERWMQRWETAFRTLEIAQLRSPMFFHVDPGDRDGMLAYARETGREADLWEIGGCVGKEVSKHKKKKRMRTRAV